MNILPEIKSRLLLKSSAPKRSFFISWRFLFLILAIFFSVSLSAQDMKKRSKVRKMKPARESVAASPKVRKAMKKQEQKKNQEMRALKKEREKASEKHLGQQSEAVRVRMAESAEESKLLNKKNKKPLFKKKFKGKRR